MVSNEEVKQIFSALPEVDWVNVEGDGYRYHLTVVSDVFIGKPLVERQQWVYAQIKSLILSGTVHALTMKTWTKEEWETQSG